MDGIQSLSDDIARKHFTAGMNFAPAFLSPHKCARLVGDGLDKFLSLSYSPFSVTLCFLNENPGEAADRISLGSIGIRKAHLHIVWQIDIRSLTCSGEGSSDKIAFFVFHHPVRHLVLKGVDKLNIAKASGCLFHQTCNARIALSTQACWPVQGRSCSNLLLPFSADLAQVITEDEGCATPVGPVNHRHIHVRELDSRIDVGEASVIPFT